MGNICSCSTGTPKPVTFTEQEVHLIVRIQAAIRGRLARLRASRLRSQIENDTVFSKWPLIPQSNGQATDNFLRSKCSDRGAGQSVPRVSHPNPMP